MKNKTAMLAAAAFIVGAVTLAPNLVSAYQGNPDIHGPNYTSERHDAIMQAFDKGDYNAWKEQMDGRGPASRITEADFSRFAEAHRLAIKGDLEGAQKIREELGLGMRDGSGTRQGMGHHHDDDGQAHGMWTTRNK